MNLPICFTFDNNYTVPAAVAFYSLIVNAKKDINFDMYVLHSDITTENQDLLKNIVDKAQKERKERGKRNDGCTQSSTLSFIHVGNFLNNEWKIGNFEDFNRGDHEQTKKEIPQFTKETLLRCFISRFLPHLNFVIYSDVDIVVIDDISELLLIDMQDKYIAGVKNPWMRHDINELSHLNKEHYEKLKNSYIGGGIWIMNLSKIREDNLESKMLKIIHDDNIVKRWNDQDVINIACDGKVVFIPLNYISLPYTLERILDWDWDIPNAPYTKKELFDSILHPKIIHYAGVKPWNGNPDKSQIWWEYFYYLNLEKTKIFNRTSETELKKISKIKQNIKNFFYGFMLMCSGIPILNILFSENRLKRLYGSIEKYRPPFCIKKTKQQKPWKY